MATKLEFETETEGPEDEVVGGRRMKTSPKT